MPANIAILIMKLRDIVSRVQRAARARLAAQNQPIASPGKKVAKAIAKSKARRAMAPFGPVTNARELWDKASTGKYSTFDRWHERSYLQAFQRAETVKYMAEILAEGFGSRVMVASAFIDGTPLFSWKSATTKKTVQGEIGDILAIVEVHDDKGPVRHFASFLQVKISNVADNVRKNTNSMGSSTRKELDLYKHWPALSFSAPLGHFRNRYSLNPGQAKTWPAFRFSHFLTISDPQSKKAVPPTPNWSCAPPPAPDSPFATFSVPGTGAKPFFAWLKDMANPYASAAEPVNLQRPAGDFDRLVVDVLSSLVDRQTRGSHGHSGGILIQHAHGGMRTFGTQAGRMINLKHYVAIPPALRSSRAIPSASLALPPLRQEGIAFSDRPMLVLYIVHGPEGEDRKADAPSQKARSNYPGAGLF